MKPFRKLHVILLWTLVPFAARNSAGQSTVVVGPPVVSALTEANSSIDTLLGLRHAAADALAGHTPTAATDFMRLAGQYDKAAADIKAAPLPTQLLPTSNTVSLSELTNCVTRPGAIVKLNTNLTEMRATKQKGDTSLAELDAEEPQMAKADEALTFLTNSFQQLSQVPVFGDQFALHWLDLQGAVSKSLASLRTAIKDQRKAFADNIALLNTEINNFQSNLALINTLPSCSPITGNWGGSGSPASTRFGGAGESCTWTVTMDNVHINLSVNAAGNIAGGSISANMHETALPPCAPSHWGNVPHNYSLARGSTNGSTLQADFNAAGGNTPRCSAHFSGSVSGGHLNGTITFHRIDTPRATLNWTTQNQVH